MTTIQEIRDALKGITTGKWSVPHFSDDKCNCDCGYVMCEQYMGAICTVHIDNGKSVFDGGSDDPPPNEARANAKLIANAPDYIRTLLDRVDQLEAAKPEYWLPKSITVADIAAQCQKAEQERDALRAELADNARTIKALTEWKDCANELAEALKYEIDSYNLGETIHPAQQAIKHFEELSG